MKHVYLLMLVFVFGWQITFAAETEPNNTSAQANTLTLNGNNNGKISPAGDVDWFKVTTNDDGKLNFTLTPLSAKSLRFYLYDKNGTSILDSANGTAAFTKSRDGLAAGIFYVKVVAGAATDTLSYTIKNTLTVPAQANDAEPNGTVALALSLAANSKTTGHVGYYYNRSRDTTDWYKITTTGDGLLKLTLTPARATDTWLYLYDMNGTHLLNSAHSNSAAAINTDGLAAGTYFVKITCVTSSQFAPYTLTDTLKQPTQANDTEPNDAKSTATTLAPNSKVTGHIGYSYNNSKDSADWYKITTTADGYLKLGLTPANGTDIWLYLYDNNGTQLLNSGHSATAQAVNTDGLAAGTYYVKIASFTSSGFAPYTLTDTLVQPAQANDVELNNSKSQALSFSLNTTKTGHVGYYYNLSRDTTDWYKITTTTRKKLVLTMTSANAKVLTMALYAGNGSSLIATKSSGNTFTLTADQLEAATYYIKVLCKSASDFAPYTLKNVTSTPTSDTIILPVNYSEKDSITTPGASQWWKITTFGNGQTSFTLTPSGKYTYLYIYDHDGTTLLSSAYGSSAFTQTVDGLAAGTYYLKVVPYYGTDTSHYTLANTFTAPAKANDTEPNNSRAEAVNFVVNTSKTGQVGYYYDHYRDTADWYKIATPSDGLLTLTLTPANGQYVYAYLYDNDGVTLLAANYSSGAFSISKDGLAAGTYYVKIICYYNSGFAPYTLKNTLTLPAQANDPELNNTKATAVTLPINSKATGHVGYYYNNYRDSADWYKITTTGDGVLKLGLTPANGQYVYIYLYDNDGTTLLNNTYSSDPFILSTDGLAAGTYYVRINCYYNNQFAPYTFTDSLIAPALANDAEPNDTKSTAKTLAPNSKVNGHTGYYYNNHRDSADWYKITTTTDGYLKLALTPANGSNTYIYLFDNNGTTLLNSTYSSGPFQLNTDGLAAGTYYVRINCYYNNQFTPYTLTDTLVSYPSVTETEPNMFPYQGSTMTANATVTGHVGFYYKVVRDTLDWWKLNYTGSGNLQFTFNLGTRKSDGGIPDVYFQVYKDTLATPVFSSYYNTASNVINLTSLAKGNYYIRIIPYYSSAFDTYSIANSFTPTAARAAAEETREITAVPDVSIYPNPATTQVHVKVNSGPADFVSVMLKDANGKQLWSQTGLGLLKGAGLDVNVRALPPGIYFLQMIDKNKQSIVKKIIVER